MLFALKGREDLENLNELISLNNQVKAVSVQDKLGKQSIHEIMKKEFEPNTDILKETSGKLTKSKTETSKEKNQALEKLNNKRLDFMNVRGIFASYLLSLSKITNPETLSQFKSLKDQ